MERAVTASGTPVSKKTPRGENTARFEKTRSARVRAVARWGVAETRMYLLPPTRRAPASNERLDCKHAVRDACLRVRGTSSLRGVVVSRNEVKNF